MTSMKSWSELPAEIRVKILEAAANPKQSFALKPESAPPSLELECESGGKPAVREGYRLAALATVSREWQSHFEAVNFRHLRLTPDLRGYFNPVSSIVRGRESLVRHISVSIDDMLSSHTSETVSSMLDDDQLDKARFHPAQCLASIITWLFMYLSRWQSNEHPGLAIEIRTMSTGPWDPLENSYWGHLFVAPVVTSLILPSRGTPLMDGSQFRRLFSATPRLESFRWEPWEYQLVTRRFHPDLNRWVEREPPHTTGLAFLQSMPSTVKSISLFKVPQSSSTIRSFLMESGASLRQTTSWYKEFMRWFSEALTRRSTQLTYLAVCYIIDAKTFLDMALRGPLRTTPEEWDRMLSSYPHPKRPEYSDWNTSPLKTSSSGPTWEHLETLTLTSRLLRPPDEDDTTDLFLETNEEGGPINDLFLETNEKGDPINDLFLKAGQLAKSMPKLRTMEILNVTIPAAVAAATPGRRQHAFIFRYESNWLNVDPTQWQSSVALLEFHSSWPFEPSKAVVAVWREVAEAQRQRLKVRVRHVP
ncbi:hypothetical protein V8F20_009616 [Naviculisporaceae sp. PSN 640]